MQRLIAEVNMLLLVQPATKSITRSTTSVSPTTVFSRIENYRQLWQISKAFDPLLGVRGFSPNDVFAQSQHILDLVRFLRLTQNMPSMPKKPAKPKGKHPNHALASAYQLLQKIHRAEESLWIDAVDVPMVEKRVITPTEVYDALQTTIAELERIKFRLGVERLQAVVRPSTKKTPNDVIQNLQWAAAAMPIFPFDRPLQQYNPISLEKTPNDVFSLATHILKTIKLYKKARGIRVKARVPPPVHGLQPHHVYQKTLESLKKIVELRRAVGFVGNVMPRSPMRPITPSDVFEFASRLDNDLHLIYEKSGINIARFQSMDINGKTGFPS